MESINFDIIYVLLFTLPGFFTVWSFRKGSKTKNPINDFEYAMFSVFWGIIVFGLFEKIIGDHFYSMTENPFAFSILVSLLTCFFSYIIGELQSGIKSYFQRS
jgi:hypothetical protein